MTTNRTCTRTLLLLSVPFLFALLVSSCSEKNNDVTDPEQIDEDIASCEGCHTSYTTLKAVYSPDTTSGGGGCGGDAPHIEPYDRVYLKPTGFAKFTSTTHYRLGCTACHGGVDKVSDKHVAHSGDFIARPSKQPLEKCGSCHGGTINLFTHSLHFNGWGQKSMVTQRYSGETPTSQLASAFEQLPATLKQGYDINCGKCHGSCGDCHVNRPTAGGGGLLNGHEFFTRPDMRENCVACHSSRGGHGYFGVGVGTVPDVHLNALGDGHCLNCHSGAEMHGDGMMVDQRYKMSLLPSCLSCHPNVAGSNTYHSMHVNTLNCYACHSQDYNNCGSCHIGGDGARIPSYQGFKIGRNPLPTVKKSPISNQAYTFVTLRQSLMAPDSWKEYGVASLPNFSVRPTYKYTTPHNILRWTSRTQVAAGKPCYDSCHIIDEGGGTYRNKQLYLFNSDLEAWEVAADAGIVVDGHLPAGWGPF